MSNPVNKRLNQQGFMMLDGALATELEQRGANLKDRLWSARVLLDEPELIRQVSLDYLTAGADVVTTATYQATFQGLKEKGLDADQARELMLFSVELALQVRDEFWSQAENRKDRLKPLVAASIGPYGAFLADGSEYHGNYGLSREELVAFHRPRMAALAESGADLLALETIPSKHEALALIELLAEFPDVPAWLSFSCKDRVQVSHGESFAECAALADESTQIVATGINCSDPRFVPALLLSAGTVKTPLMAYPNSGEQWDGELKHWTGERCSAIDARSLFEAGASLIGGCCRSTPADILQARKVLRSLVE